MQKGQQKAKKVLQEENLTFNGRWKKYHLQREKGSTYGFRLSESMTCQHRYCSPGKGTVIPDFFGPFVGCIIGLAINKHLNLF
jgi:hypothetical protein